MMTGVSEAALKSIWEWQQATKLLEQVKATEVNARKALVEDLASCGVLASDIMEGTINIALPNDWKLKVVRKLNRTVDVPALSTIGARCLELKISLDKVIRYKAELAIAEFKKLTDEQQKVIESALTIKPGTPTLELVAPSNKE